MLSVVEFKRLIRERGWVLLEAIVPKNLVTEMADDLEFCYQHCRSVQIENGIGDNNEATVHHLIGQRDSYFRYLEARFVDTYLEQHFEGPFILNSFGGAINKPAARNYSHNIHRDVRTFTVDFPLLANTLVMLDDFTKDNGATYLLSGSHHLKDKPDEAYFYAHAEQMTAPAGSVLVFDSNIWHAGGDNRTDRLRRSVTPMYSRPFIKQQFDYPRAIGYEARETLSENMRQIIGYNSRVPMCLHEWYQPPEKRMYKGNQG